MQGAQRIHWRLAEPLPQEMVIRERIHLHFGVPTRLHMKLVFECPLKVL